MSLLRRDISVWDVSVWDVSVWDVSVWDVSVWDVGVQEWVVRGNVRVWVGGSSRNLPLSEDVRVDLRVV